MLTSSYFGKKMLHNFFQSKKITTFFLLWFLFFSLLTSQFTHSCISTMILLFSVSDFSKNGSKNWNIAFGVSTFNGNIINCFFILFFPDWITLLAKANRGLSMGPTWSFMAVQPFSLDAFVSEHYSCKIWPLLWPLYFSLYIPYTLKL